MFFLSSCLISSFGPGLQNKNGSHNIADIEAIAISHEESLNFHAAVGLYFVAKGGLESFPDTQKAGLIRFAIRNILRDVTLAPMTANGYGRPFSVPQSRRNGHSVNNWKGSQIRTSM